MKKCNKISELNMSDRINVQNEIFNLLDDCRQGWADMDAFYASTAEDFESYYVNEAWDEEGNSLGECILLTNRYAVEYNQENWEEFSEIFADQLLKVKHANEE